MESIVGELPKFLEKYHFLIDFYAIEFITNDIWKTWPTQWKFLEDYSIEQLANLYVKPDEKLGPFIEQCRLFSVNRKPTISTKVFNKYILMGMNTKKVAEISSIAITINKIGLEKSVAGIIDVGGGQGYLSSVLALEFGYQVIAIDYSSSQITGGQKRFNRIRDLYQKSGKEIMGSLSFCHRSIGINENYDELVNEMEYRFGIHGPWMIVGLHTCGDLAVSMIRGFVGSERKKIRALVSVGCCYQLLTEGPGCGFPISKKYHGYRMGGNQRLVACQPPGRLKDPNILGESVRRLFYRSVLQKILKDMNVLPSDESVSLAVRKMGVIPYASPISYCRAAIERIGCNLTITDEVILHYFKLNAQAERRIAGIWTLRGLLSDVLESFLLLDRYEFVIENGLECEIIPFVDATVSPRNMALIIS